jgi:hypothetical protein
VSYFPFSVFFFFPSITYLWFGVLLVAVLRCINIGFWPVDWECRASFVLLCFSLPCFCSVMSYIDAKRAQAEEFHAKKCRL